MKGHPMTEKTLRSADGTRGADIFQVAGGDRYQIQAHKYPASHDHMLEGGLWFGGRILWGLDQDSMEAAVAVAAEWVDGGVLPDHRDPFARSGF
jgi:hypothetical protein